ncbi:MAG: maltose alpha-D-glucosyltransferase [Segetibacter sp.]|nr:maltose alpha-D-glucosyltransferase [Segetibacter sp.]
MEKKQTVLNDKLHWYKDAVIYELHIKAFNDGNDDGIGDFKGLLEKLDYLQELGITAIWVLPFYPSPLRDDGYDIADYYNINPSYGDIEQFKEFLDEAHRRNLKVITELVINHTSDQHPWFQGARRATKGSPEREYYVWTDDPQQYKDVRIIFQDFEASNWTWDPVAQQYYWHRFFHHQPDLNFDSALVQEEIFKILDYWCAMGVDGFRLDAVPYLFEREGTNGENLPETHAFLKKLRKHIDSSFPSTVFLAEANMWPEDSASYFGDGDECHMNYHFPIMPRMFMSVQMEDRYPVTDIFDQTPAIPETCQWAIFLRNHDELTLEMVTDEERDYMYKVYAKDPKAKINLGIRHRLAPLMENNRRKIELMNSLLFSLAGTPVIYYGDEIGMGDNYYLGDRDGVRTPMQWSPDRNAGFSLANPQKLYLPLILDPEYHYEAVNVEAQWRNPSSLLWFMKNIIAMRKNYKAFGRGDQKFINLANPKVLSFTRTYEDETILVVVNLSRYSQAAEIDLRNYKGYVPVEVFSKNKFPVIKEDPYFFTLSPYAYHWFALQKVSAATNDKTELPLLRINDWNEGLKDTFIEELESNVLPAYLQQNRWFTGKGRTIYEIQVTSLFSVQVNEMNSYFLLLEVHYEHGLPETYQLPVTLTQEEFANTLMETSPQAVIARVQSGEEEQLLCDALYIPEFQKAIIVNMANGHTIRLKDSEVIFNADEEVKKHINGSPEVKSRILPVEDTNTSIGYDNSFFLKIYRKVDRAVNPDVEITRFLTEQAKFAQVPQFLGEIVWKDQKDIIVLGMLQVMVEYHGNGRTYMFERLNNLHERITARQQHPSYQLKKSLIEPVDFDQVPEDLKEFVGGTVAEGARLLGIRTGEMHKALASVTGLVDFKPEEFSLHYQRSLFAGLQSLVRATFQNLERNLSTLSAEVRQPAEEILGKKEDVLSILKTIYTKKFDTTKIRIHGNYHLRKVLFTGKDIAILDFGGDPTRSYSERRLKRSPLRDVAGMIRSFHYAAYEGFLLKQKDEINKLLPFAELWTHHVSGYFVHAYLQTVDGSTFIPKEKNNLNVMLQTYLLEKAIYSLNYELDNRQDLVIIPLRLIQTTLK